MTTPEIDTETSPAAATPATNWLGLAAMALGAAMIVIDATVVGVALPTIIRDLGLDAPSAEWVNSVYAFMFAALVITLGHFADRFGRRLLFLAGIVVFLAGSIFAGLAPNGGLLVVARIIQGAGGAAVLTAGLSSVNALFTGRDRAMAFAIWGMVIGGFAAIGPFIGGVLTTDVSWRWAFFVNIPIGIITFAGVVAWISESRNAELEETWDVGGTILSALGLGLLVFGLIEGERYGWWKPLDDFDMFGLEWPLDAVGIAPLALIAGGISLVAFYIYERRRRSHGRSALVDFSLFELASYRWGNIAALFVGIGEYGLIFVLPLAMQNMLGWSAMGTGIVMLALAGGSFLGPIFGEFAHRVGPRPIVIAGLALETVAMAALAFVITPNVTGGVIAACIFFYGTGVGAATAQLGNITLGEIAVSKSGQGSGVRTTARQLGSSLGVAILGIVFVTAIGVNTTDRLTAEGLPTEIASRVSDDVAQSFGADLPRFTAIPGRASIRDPVDDAFSDAVSNTLFAAAAFLFAGLLAGFMLPKQDTQAGESAAAGAATRKEATSTAASADKLETPDPDEENRGAESDNRPGSS